MVFLRTVSERAKLCLTGATGGICKKGERCETGESGEMSANGGTSKTCGKSRMRRALETLLPPVVRVALALFAWQRPYACDKI